MGIIWACQKWWIYSHIVWPHSITFIWQIKTKFRRTLSFIDKHRIFNIQLCQSTRFPGEQSTVPIREASWLPRLRVKTPAPAGVVSMLILPAVCLFVFGFAQFGFRLPHPYNIGSRMVQYSQGPEMETSSRCVGHLGPLTMPYWVKSPNNSAICHKGHARLF